MRLSQAKSLDASNKRRLNRVWRGNRWGLKRFRPLLFDRLRPEIMKLKPGSGIPREVKSR